MKQFGILDSFAGQYRKYAILFEGPGDRPPQGQKSHLASPRSGLAQIGDWPYAGLQV